MPDQYLKPKMLNSWQLSRAIMPPRSYKTFRGATEQDGRELYRWRAQPDEIAQPDPAAMGEQHIKWMGGHTRQRDKHLYPIYYHRVALRDYLKKREKIIEAADVKVKEVDEDALITDVDGNIVFASADKVRIGAEALGEGKEYTKRLASGSSALGRSVDRTMLQRSMSVPSMSSVPLMATYAANGVSIEGMAPDSDATASTGSGAIARSKDASKAGGGGGYDAATTAKLRKLNRPHSPDLGKPPIDINPKLFKYINRHPKSFGLSLPHELPLEVRTMETEYLPKVLEKNAKIEKRKADEKRKEALRAAKQQAANV